MTRVEITRGHIAHCSGALYLEESGSLFIADAHLGYGWAQRRRGQLGPLSDGGIEEKLNAVVAEFQPAELIFLGDTVHAPKPGGQERAFVEAVLTSLLERTRLRVIEGNHDRAFRRDFGHLLIPIEKQWRQKDVLALHGDKIHLELPEAGHYILGHFHPAVGLRDEAKAVRRAPVFCAGPRATVLPAFSPFAAGVDLTLDRLPKHLTDLLGDFRVLPVTGRRIAELPLAVLRARRFQA